MSTSPLPARRKWSGIIRQQRLSGLPVAEFCRRNGIATSSFFPWKRKLARPAAEPCFVEVDIQQLNPVSLPAPVVTSGIERERHVNPIYPLLRVDGIIGE
jgi:transposase-like protein